MILWYYLIELIPFLYSSIKILGVQNVKKVLYTNFVTPDEILSVMMEQKEIKKAITRSNLYKFWSKVVGPKFAEKSKPYSMLGGGTMVIACENAIVAQELMLKKTQLLVKLQPYMKSLKMNVKDLKFDAKKWLTEEE